MTTPLRTRLRSALTDAMRERDRTLAAALRSAIAALENAEAVVVDAGATTGAEHVAGAAIGVGATEAARRELTDAEEQALLRAEVMELHAAAEKFAGVGEADRAADAVRVAAVLDALGED